MRLPLHTDCDVFSWPCGRTASVSIFLTVVVVVVLYTFFVILFFVVVVVVV